MPKTTPGRTASGAPTGHAALRKGRVSLPGQIYHVTCTTEARRRWFEDFWLARAVVREIAKMDIAGRSETLASVLMPDHLHWLLQLRTDTTLATLMDRFKSGSARAANRMLNRSGAVWARAYHDHALRDDEDVVAIARYIVANPVRAGLVHSVRDYSHWWAKWL